MPIPIASCKFGCSTSLGVGREAEKPPSYSTETDMHVAPLNLKTKMMTNACKTIVARIRIHLSAGQRDFGDDEDAGSHKIITLRSEGYSK